MRFDWDDANLNHLAAHGVTSEEFEQAFRNDPILLSRTQHHRERRIVAVGETDQARVLFMVYTRRRSRIRAVTAYTAPRKLKSSYAKQKSTKGG
jgi:uncharacterized protein